MNTYQRLDDFFLIQGEYKIININPKSSNGEARSMANITPTLKVYFYNERDNEVLSVNGVKADNYSCSFTIPSSETANWSGKLEYIISLTYSDGNATKGLGHIVIV